MRSEYSTEARLAWIRRACDTRGWPTNVADLSAEQLAELRVVLPWPTATPAVEAAGGWRRPLPPGQRNAPFDAEMSSRGALPEEQMVQDVGEWRPSYRDMVERALDELEDEDNAMLAGEHERFLNRLLGALDPARGHRAELAKLLSRDIGARVLYHNRRDYSGGTLTVAQWEAIRRAYGQCAYCGNPSPTVIEHVIPLSRGGRTNAGNIVPSCWACNTEKGTSLVEEWLFGERLEAFRRRHRNAARRLRALK